MLNKGTKKQMILLFLMYEVEETTVHTHVLSRKLYE